MGQRFYRFELKCVISGGQQPGTYIYGEEESLWLTSPEPFIQFGFVEVGEDCCFTTK